MIDHSPTSIASLWGGHFILVSTLLLMHLLVMHFIADRLSMRRIIIQQRRSNLSYHIIYILCRSETLGKDQCTVALILVKIVVQYH